MTTRRATQADEAVLQELWSEFEREVPGPPELEESWTEEWQDTRRNIDDGFVLIAEDSLGATGYVRLEPRAAATWHIATAFVRPRARRQGVLRALLQEGLREGRARGAETVTLDVLLANEVGLATWQSLGFVPALQYMRQPLDALERRLTEPAGPTFGSIHVQTDDRQAVAGAVERYRPRIAGPGGTDVTEPRNGWVSIYDEVTERDPELLKRFARELSYASGSVVVVFTVEQEAAVGYAIYERGSSVDDYLSIPDFHGPLPPGDVVSLAANPRVVQRLTGADPGMVRAVARNAASPAELAPARELVAQIAATMGIVDADRGYGD